MVWQGGFVRFGRFGWVVGWRNRAGVACVYLNTVQGCPGQGCSAVALLVAAYCCEDLVTI